MLKKPDIKKIFSVWREANPEPQTELEYTNVYTLLVAIVLSAQATDKGVNKATRALFQVADTPQKMLNLGEAGLKEYIKTIGLYNSKAKNIIELSRKLTDEFSGKIPEDFDKLITLPGVGRKTANVLLNAAFGKSTIAVDTHVFRVAKRLGLASSNTADSVSDELAKNVPAEFKQHAHHWLILHGRYTCKARNPDCAACKVSAWCEYFIHNHSDK